MLIRSTVRQSQPVVSPAGVTSEPTAVAITVKDAPKSSEPKAEDLFSRTVAETADDWGTMGQKIGALSLVAAGTSIIPFQAMMRFPSMPIPAVIALSIGTMAGLSIEERKLGLGKKLGKTIGQVLGTGAGAAKGALGWHPENSKTPITLKRVAPESVKRYEPLAPKLLHTSQRIFGGAEAKRTRAVEFGEMLGATAGVMATSYLVPKLAVALAGDNALVAGVAGSLVGPLAGMVVGGWQESSLGIGRAVGELIGSGFSKAGIGDTMPKDMAIDDFKGKASEPGALKKAFLGLNKAIAEPIIGPLVDATVASNVMFGEEPVQTMTFSERPAPKVNRERLVNNFVELTGIYGPSGEEQLIGQELAKRAEKLGATVHMTDDGSIIATMAATPGFEDAPTVLLSAHQDTVEPTDPSTIRQNDYKIYTDGSHILGADDRAGLAQILEGIESVQEQGQAHPELKLVFPVDEERGLRGAARMQPEDISNRPTLGYVVDALDVDTLHLNTDAVLLTPRSIKYSFKQSDPVAQVALRSMAMAGTDTTVLHTPILTGAGSDANTPAFNTGHIRTMAVGVGETNMHTGMEQIKKNDLERAARHVVGYITNACDLKVVGDEIVPRFE